MTFIATRQKVPAGGWRITKLARPYHLALARIAGSQWGDVGIGSCPNKKTGAMLVKLGLARFCKKQDGHDDIYQITYRGFQLLERMKWDAILKSRKPILAIWPRREALTGAGEKK